MAKPEKEPNEKVDKNRKAIDKSDIRETRGGFVDSRGRAVPKPDADEELSEKERGDLSIPNSTTAALDPRMVKRRDLGGGSK